VRGWSFTPRCYDVCARHQTSTYHVLHSAVLRTHVGVGALVLCVDVRGLVWRKQRQVTKLVGDSGRLFSVPSFSAWFHIALDDVARQRAGIQLFPILEGHRADALSGGRVAQGAKTYASHW